MLESIQPDPTGNPSLTVNRIDPIPDRHQSGRQPVRQLYSIGSVTLHGGSFRPNHEHEWVGHEVLHRELDGLSLAAGGLTFPSISQVLFDSDAYTAVVRGRLTRLHGKLGPNMNGAIGTGFREHLLEVVESLPAPLADIGESLAVIQASARGLTYYDQVKELGLSYAQVHRAHSEAIAKWQVPNTSAAITMSILGKPIPQQDSE